jgi:hypothetical protein
MEDKKSEIPKLKINKIDQINLINLISFCIKIILINWSNFLPGFNYSYITNFSLIPVNKYVCWHPVIYRSFLLNQSAYWDITEYLYFMYVTFMAHKWKLTALIRNAYFSFDSNPLIYMEAGNIKKETELKIILKFCMNKDEI